MDEKRYTLEGWKLKTGIDPVNLLRKILQDHPGGIIVHREWGSTNSFYKELERHGYVTIEPYQHSESNQTILIEVTELGKMYISLDSL